MKGNTLQRLSLLGMAFALLMVRHHVFSELSVVSCAEPCTGRHDIRRVTVISPGISMRLRGYGVCIFGRHARLFKLRFLVLVTANPLLEFITTVIGEGCL